MSQEHLDLIRQVLDQHVIDANHFPCGRVDDIEIEGGKALKVTALLIGNGAASGRLPALAKWVSRKLFGSRIVRVPWERVSVITNDVKLNATAKELKLDERTGWIYRFISKFPGAWKK
jgi:sporulation protein YlmC with PRC-barrel domain